MGAYAAVTAAYWAFMLTDGALRMLVLLHFHQLGYAPVTLAFLFLIYEAMGVVTNLSAGWIAARFGLSRTLYAGLAVQILALGALAMLDPGWSAALLVPYVMLVQGASGVAKDLAKMSSKSAVKLLAPEEGGGLFRWVALLTGSKNAIKGLGFFLGALLLGQFGFAPALLVMAAGLMLVLLAVALLLPEGLPKGRASAKFREVWSRNPAINRLSMARLFLFGARDVWFVVGIPVYFTATLTGRGVAAQDAFFWVGGAMALWVILYGGVQALAPRLLGRPGLQRGTIQARRWVALLGIIPLGLALGALVGGPFLTPLLIVGLLGFGAVFAVNSSLHSYLILALSDKERVTMDVGFYYMSNAAGRLVGTLLSGLTMSLGGLPLCLAVAAAMIGGSYLAVSRMGDGQPRPGREAL